MKRSLFALALAAALPFSAQASELKYSYVQAGYQSTDLEGFNFDGYGVKGSVAFGDQFYGVASYNHGSESGVDLAETMVGVGFHHGVSDKADLFAEIAYINDDADFFNDNGYRVTGGVRGMMADKFEGSFQINYTDVNDFGKGWGAGVGAVYHVNDTWGVYASYDYSDRDSSNLNTWGLGVRASF